MKMCTVAKVRFNVYENSYIEVKAKINEEIHINDKAWKPS
jgi:hypothetical protein